MKSWRDEARQILAALESEMHSLSPPTPSYQKIFLALLVLGALAALIGFWLSR